jgi:hypothetical protein
MAGGRPPSAGGTTVVAASDEAIAKSQGFLTAVGDGECEILQVLEMAPPAR